MIVKHKEAKRRTKKSEIETINSSMSKLWQIKVRDTLKAQKLSQRKLADLAGLGATSIRHLVTKADTVTVETLRRIADATNLPISYFITGSSFLIQDMGTNDDGLTRKVFVLPIHGPRDNPPGEDYGRGYATVPEKDAGVSPYAFCMGDSSMLGIGANHTIDPMQAIGPEDVIVYDTARTPTPGQIAIVNIGEKGDPTWAARIYEEDGDDVYAAALSRSYGRKLVSREHIQGVCTTIIRRAAR